MKKNLGELCRLLNGELMGPPEFFVTGVQSLEAAGPDQISFAVGRKYRDEVRDTRAGALILPKDWPDYPDRPVIFVENPYLAYAHIAALFSSTPFEAGGVSPEAHIGIDCRIHADVSIRPGAHIGDRVRIGPNVTIHPGVCLGDDVSVGDGTTVYPNVTVYQGCSIGSNVIIHAGVVIGGDGFGYVWDGNTHVKIPHTGTVVIEDHVEIGANTTIDRGALGETRIGRGTKIDNLVMVGHNVQVGENSILVAHVGLAGSCRLGRGVVIGGQAGVAGHIELGDGVQVAAQSGVVQSVPASQVVSGSPAIPHRIWLKAILAFKRLPQLVQDVRELKKRISRLEDGS